MPIKKKIPILSALMGLCVVLYGCSRETQLAAAFHFPTGSTFSFQTNVSVAYAHSGLYFSLSDIPVAKNDRDFSDFISIELINDKGEIIHPEKIWDINGQKRDVVAFCNNIPKRTHIKQIRIEALQELKGNKIRWWSGSLN
jgi:hypothetical protein